MPVIPGGKGYRLPLISNDELAGVYCTGFQIGAQTIQTYTLI